MANLAASTLALVLLLVVPSVAVADMGNVTASYGAAPPSFGASVTIPASVAMRSVYGTLKLSPTALASANVTISNCGAVTLEAFNTPQISGNTETWSYAFTMRGGDCYQFNNNADPNAANQIVAYNLVDVANETFESRAHANATWCPVTDCANNTYLNETIKPPTGVHVRFVSKALAIVIVSFDPNSTRPTDDIHVDFAGGPSPLVFSPPFSIPGQLGADLYPPAGWTCAGNAEVWAQDPITSEQSRHESAFYNCDTEDQTADMSHVSGVRAQVVGADVLIQWQMNNEVDEGFFQIEGNASSTQPRYWGIEYDITGSPFYYLDDPSARQYLAPLSDFSTDPTYLVVEYWTNDTTNAMMSCEVNLSLDGAVHACGSLANATTSLPDDDAAYATWTYVNATFCPLPCTAGGGGSALLLAPLRAFPPAVATLGGAVFVVAAVGMVGVVIRDQAARSRSKK